MVLDKVLTVAIGRNQQNGKPMPAQKWQEFQKQVKEVLSDNGLVVAHANGGAIGSDGLNEGADEETAVFVTINPKSAANARKRIASLLPEYEQGSAAFAFDGAHEPVFATATGWRA